MHRLDVPGINERNNMLCAMVSKYMLSFQTSENVPQYSLFQTSDNVLRYSRWFEIMNTGTHYRWFEIKNTGTHYRWVEIKNTGTHYRWFEIMNTGNIIAGLKYSLFQTSDNMSRYSLF
jgi:hypothetical protein